MSKYTIHVDDQDFIVETDDLSTFNMHKIAATNFHVLKDSRAFDVKLVSENMLKKKMTVSINGNPYDVKIDDVFDIMVAEMGLLEKTEATSNNVNAPMPGHIIDIMIKPGDTIEDGTPLFILSAMKMENVILSDGKGVVKSIEAKVNDAVVKGQLIIEMEA